MEVQNRIRIDQNAQSIHNSNKIRCVSIISLLFMVITWTTRFFSLVGSCTESNLIENRWNFHLFLPSFLPMMSHSLDHQSEWFSVFCSTVGKANTKRRRRHFRNIYKWRRSKKTHSNNRTLLNSPSWDPSPRRTVAFTLQLSSSLRIKCVFETRSNNVSCHIFGRQRFQFGHFIR